MCCCGAPCCLIFGCTNINATIDKPEEYPNPPDKILCPCCGEIEAAVYKKTFRSCGICFIPCCPCGSSDPYLACKKCNFPLGGLTTEKCNSCGVSTTYNSDYCPNCGSSRPSTRTNTFTPSNRRSNPSRNENRRTANGNGSVIEDDNNDSDEDNHKTRKVKDLKDNRS